MTLTGSQIAANMKRGINLGSTFERTSNSTSPDRVRPLLLSAWKKGYRHVRIPVTWMGDNCYYDLTNAIDYAIGLGFIVILNSHHENWLNNGYAMTDEQNGIFWQHWKDVATYYKSRWQSKLIFEILNEPHGVFGEYNQGGDRDCNCNRAIQLTQRINKTGFDGIRMVDKTRVICFQPNAMGNISTCCNIYPNAASLPGGGYDKYLIVSVHTYDPWNFCGQDGNDSVYLSQSNWWLSLHADIDKRFTDLTNWHSQVGGDSVVGVAIGEFGVGRTNNSNLNSYVIEQYYKYTTQVCLSHNWGVCAWDDCNNGWFEVSRIDNGVVSYPHNIANAMFDPRLT
jgi:endoglucanase